jgi:hypothetical protein
MISVESRVYNYAGAALADYGGGYWEFAETDNGAGVMIPPPGKHRTIADGYEWHETEFCCNSGDLSREAAGLAITTLAVNHQLWKVAENPQHNALALMLQQEWERLMETVYEHPESAELLKILD